MRKAISHNRGLLAVSILLLATLVILPILAPQYIVLQITLYFSYAILALSLAFVWGIAGIFSFGQAAFFGLGGYTYAVVAINVGESTLAVLAGLALPAVIAAVIGYFMFYGRLTSIYVAVITLVMTLIIFKFMGHTAGYEYRIGSAHLGGYNGIPGIPPLNVPGDPTTFAWPEDMFYVSGIALLLTYISLKILIKSRLGRVLAGVRENELRSQLLGYDVRLYKTIAFVIGATIAGLGTFFGPMFAAVALGFLAIELGAQQSLDVNLILGSILIIFVLVVPAGIVPSLLRLTVQFRRKPLGQHKASGQMEGEG
jgi:branched-chain amino acid transport system permease protein